jgi:hypothetical protein
VRDVSVAVFDPVAWHRRAAELSLRTPFSHEQWLMLLPHCPDITNNEAVAALHVWYDTDQGDFVRILKILTDIKGEDKE